MATTATALSDSQLEAELQRLQTEGASVRKKLNDDTQKLAAARADRSRIVDGIARGTVKESEAPRNQSEIDAIGIRIEGYNSLLAENRSKTDELEKELYQRQAAAIQAAREKECAELKQQGAELGRKIFEQLTRLATEDLPALNDIRGKLGSQFRDLDGEGEARRLRELFFKPAGPHEKLHDPNVHTRRLVDQGFLFDTGFPGGDFAVIVTSMRRPIH